MIRQNEYNYILKFPQLFHQCIVDMYAKIERERSNLTNFRSESSFIHLQDVFKSGGNIRNNEFAIFIFRQSTSYAWIP